MPCYIRRTKNGLIVYCSRRQQRKCFYCSDWRMEVLCDWPIGEGKTCDRPCCRAHSKRVGPNVDYCEQHSRS